jgi:DNA-binding response OmpR family regulator
MVVYTTGRGISPTILLIDDDSLLRRSLAYTLGRAGYSTRTAGTTTEGLQLAQETPPDLVILDIGLPGIDGLDALQLLRKERHVPVILLTARRSEQDEALGLTLGADDYIKKPYDADVLLARISAVLRRSRPGARIPGSAGSPGALCVGNLWIDPVGRIARVGEEILDLTPRAFDLLYLLASHANVVVPLNDILRRLWGADFDGEPQVLYVHIRWLRERLASIPCVSARIVTVHRVGYKLVVEDDPCSAASAAG